MDLAEWQKRAHKAIRMGEGAAEAFAEPARVRAYSLSFPAVVRGSLEDDFPLLMRLLGRARFHALVREFHSVPRGYFVEVRAIAPAFLCFLEAGGAAASTLRAARIDLLAEEARLAPEPAVGGVVFGLHPSARLLEAGRRSVCVWRQEGVVCREKLSPEELTLLRCFEKPAELAEISARLERAGLAMEFVQEAVAVWSASGVIGAFFGNGKATDIAR